jgi:hypothetical protein
MATDAPYWINYWSQESANIKLARQSSAQAPLTALIGDSRFLAMRTPTLGGRPTHNMSLSGARVSTIKNFVVPQLSISGLSAAILCIGINNVLIPPVTDVEWTNFSADYNDLVASIQAVVPRLTICTVPPVESNGTSWDAAGLAPRVKAVNDIIRQIRLTRNVRLLDLAALYTGADGTLWPGGSTFDQVHFTPPFYHGCLFPQLDLEVRRLWSEA